MSTTYIDRVRIARKARKLLGEEQKDAADRFVFMQQCIPQLVADGTAESEDDARDVCELLYEEGLSPDDAEDF